jgi:hypothetical protein
MARRERATQVIPRRAKFRFLDGPVSAVASPGHDKIWENIGRH